MEFTLGHFHLRELVSGDVEALYEAVRESLPALSRWFWWAHEGYDISETRKFIQSIEASHGQTDDITFGIFDLENKRLLGGVGVNRIDSAHKVGNLGYWVRTSATGQGIATRVARGVSQFSLRNRGLHRVEIVVAVGNEASLKVAANIGAVREGLLRSRLLIEGHPHDAYMHSLILSDL